MEVKVTSTGNVSRFPNRFCVHIVIQGTGSNVNEARATQERRMRFVTSVLSESKVNLKFLSTPNVQELSRREEYQKNHSIKETRWVRDGYRVYQYAEIAVDGWDSSLVSAFMDNLTPACEGNLSSWYELTEVQKAEMSMEAMEKSYSIAVEYANKLYSLEKGRNTDIIGSTLNLKEVKVIANDFGTPKLSSEINMLTEKKSSSAYQECSPVKEIIPIRKPITISNTVEYIFSIK